MNVIFAGTPDFASTALNSIVAAGFTVPLVLTQPDRPKGRGMKLQYSSVKETALSLGLTIAQPGTLRGNDEALTMLHKAQADVMVVAAYGLILPQNVLDIPKHGCLNIHASLLPRWRGAAPIQRAIEAGDVETGVCIMQMDSGLDTGNIISTHHHRIADTDTANEVHDALMYLGAHAIVEDLKRLQNEGHLDSTPQTQDGITYAAKLSKNEARIHWDHPASNIERIVRAFNPAPAAWTTWHNIPLKIWRAHKIAIAHTAAAGTVIATNSHGITIACGMDALLITELQASGGKRMNTNAFVSGHSIQIGDILL